MNNFISYLLFFVTLFFLTSISSFLMIWSLMEINLFSMLTMKTFRSSSMEMESKLFIYLTQIISSLYLLLTTVSLGVMDNFIFIVVILKLGLFPLFFWLYYLSGVSLIVLFIISAPQKIFIFFILTFFNFDYLIFYCCLLSLLIVLYNYSQFDMKIIIIFSSVFHMCWILLGFCSSYYLWFFYIFFYMVISYYLIFFLLENPGNTVNKDYFKFFILLILISVSGMPPFFSFYPKLYILINSEFLIFFLFAFLVFTIFNINLYFRIVVFKSLLFSKMMKFNTIDYSVYSLFFLNLMSCFLFL